MSLHTFRFVATIDGKPAFYLEVDGTRIDVRNNLDQGCSLLDISPSPVPLRFALEEASRDYIQGLISLTNYERQRNEMLSALHQFSFTNLKWDVYRT